MFFVSVLKLLKVQSVGQLLETEDWGASSKNWGL